MELLDIEVGKLARENYAIIQLFNKNNIDFFCKGTKSLKEALAESGTEKEKFLKELKEIRSCKPQLYAVDVEKWPLDLLADYVQKTHHPYTEQALLKIKDCIKIILGNESEEAKIIGEFNPTFELLSGGLATHMKKEELMLFPAIKRMSVKHAGGDTPKFNPIDKSVETMIDEHDMQYKALRKIREVLNGYIFREGKDDYNKIIQLMHELDENLARHIHLENNILFPKAVELAKGLS
ncbi:MAG: DUF542 domain-containing protein [Ginsengibacter sp.]